MQEKVKDRSTKAVEMCLIKSSNDITLIVYCCFLRLCYIAVVVVDADVVVVVVEEKTDCVDVKTILF